MDNKLVCDAVNCVHNYNNLCAAEVIKVEGDHTMGGRFTYCDSFTNKSVGGFVSSLGNTNYNGALKQMLSDRQVMDPQVNCSAVNCIYNEGQVCKAESLKIINEVSSTAEQTECQTFYPR